MSGPNGSSRRGAGQLENEVLAALWAAEQPLTPVELLTAMDGTLAYNTIHTILTRLQEKNLVARVRDGNRRAYAPVKDQAQLAAERMRAVLDTGNDRTEILQRFVTALSPADEEALRTFLAEHP